MKQLKYRIHTLPRLKSVISLSPREEAALSAMSWRWGTTPYFASLMDKRDPDCPIRKQVLPSMEEVRALDALPSESFMKGDKNGNDPVSPLASSKATPRCIDWKYPDRVAFLVSNRCASYCRFCFRKLHVMTKTKSRALNLEAGLHWIRKHRMIRDVLITGGDPFVLPDARIEELVRRLREIRHLEMIRFGTRVPIVLPQRITPSLCRILGKHHRVPLWINIHCNHPREITPHTAKAVYALVASGIHVGNQAVLLKGINDDEAILRHLHQKLLSIRVRPYYLFHCEKAPGNEIFRTSGAQGERLLNRALSDRTTGLARPLWAVETKRGKQTTLCPVRRVALS